jgi:hypothetical protein
MDSKAEIQEFLTTSPAWITPEDFGPPSDTSTPTTSAFPDCAGKKFLCSQDERLVYRGAWI